MYKLFFRSVLFLFDAETAHHLSFRVLKTLSKFSAGSIFRRMFEVNHPALEREVFGLRFKNPVGLAAGFDKNAELYNELSDFGTYVYHKIIHMLKKRLKTAKIVLYSLIVGSSLVLPDIASYKYPVLFSQVFYSLNNTFIIKAHPIDDRLVLH